MRAMILAIGISLFLTGTARASDLVRAEAAAGEATALYEAGRFEEAAERFLDAFALSSEPIQLRNAAKAYEMGRLYPRALARWQEYALLAGADRNEAAAHIAQIQDAVVVKPRVPLRAAVVVEAPPLVAPHLEEKDRTAGWVTLGSGAAIAAAGTVLWIIAANQLSALEQRIDQRDAGGRITGISRAGAQGDLGRINTERTLSGVLLGAGAVAAGVGASLTWIEW